jgi:hypothetical protein
MRARGAQVVEVGAEGGLVGAAAHLCAYLAVDRRQRRRRGGRTLDHLQDVKRIALPDRLAHRAGVELRRAARERRAELSVQLRDRQQRIGHRRDRRVTERASDLGKILTRTHARRRLLCNRARLGLGTQRTGGDAHLAHAQPLFPGEERGILAIELGPLLFGRLGRRLLGENRLEHRPDEPRA